ncbi:MAG: hypothetical protein CVV47_03060 [Spirochaetae bacterium HGW-Spirochaetae-3]|jgi:hypothetical protein|nr:MAG: hypothetical protein CVV47_03060 [Spirochaetae bacterium HGW-Spirochaetae-3]
MSVFVSVEDPEGEPLIAVFEVERVFRKFPQDSGCCLRFVSDTVDASFNALQGPALTAELESVLEAGLDEAERRELDRVLAVCKKHAGKKNEYVKFYGEAKSEE